MNKLPGGPGCESGSVGGGQFVCYAVSTADALSTHPEYHYSKKYLIQLIQLTYSFVRQFKACSPKTVLHISKQGGAGAHQNPHLDIPGTTGAW
jgi:hypothetical protein